MMRNVIRYSIICWAIFGILVVVVFLPMGDLETILIRVATFLIPQIFLFYINLLYLFPNFLEKKKKTTYFTSLIVIVILVVILFGNLDNYLNEHTRFDIPHLHKRSGMFVFIGRFMASMPPLIISALIRNSLLLQQKTKESLELQNKVLEAETKALKAQVNPHFLFNTLNNIYSLSQFDSKKTGEAILQLSDILRFVTYESNQQKVPLNSELENIESFIKLQLLKDTDTSNIHIDIRKDNAGLQISPLLLLPFVENCFKHANHHDKTNGWIKISVQTTKGELTMITSNSTTNEISPKDKVGGVGMENVRRRLALLYPNQHDLVIRIDKHSYTATLKIDLQS